jgi:hypothetical protein
MSRHDLPEYAACERCEEYAAVALAPVGGRVLCLNCRDDRHPRGACLICRGVLPVEEHHVGARVAFPTLTATLCLNDHAILTARQYHWRRAGWAEAHPLASLVRGVVDLLWLWQERSPVGEQCRELFVLLGRVGLCLLTSLRPEALGDLGHLADWSWSWSPRLHPSTT